MTRSDSSSEVTVCLKERQEALELELGRYGRLAVAYSGGVDSAYLAWSAYQVLGERMLAVLADSPSLPRVHFAFAQDFAGEHGIPLHIVQTREMERPEYVRNDAMRCFHCKDELFLTLESVLKQFGLDRIAYGRNLDDGQDFRPGQQVAQQHHAVAPLADAGLRKEHIRALAQAAGLRVWDRPASACLSSRLEYSRPVTTVALRQVEEAEQGLLALGFRQLRVRHHGDLARIEFERAELPHALSVGMLSAITRSLRAAGFTFVTLDTEGYRSGSMNTLLTVADVLRASTIHAS